MKELLIATRDALRIMRMVDRTGRIIVHYLMPDRTVIEVVLVPKR